jgi:uncharacterized protein (DUF1800 family)
MKRRDATHLLWRTQFGASEAQVQQAAADGLEKTLERILTTQPENVNFDDTAALLRQSAIDSGNIEQLKTWWLYRMTTTANPLVERMSLFWHNHFATSNIKVRSTRLMADQNDLIRTHAVGDFKQLVKGMARDVAMLIWLDGNANKKRSPNENFARELMELFTLGVGNYSEQDIKEAARAFSGWHVRKENFWFNSLQHDSSNKTVFNKSGPLNGDDIIDLCLAHEACPRFFAKKLLREFVTPNPDVGQIATLASSIRKHDYAMTPVLRDLFGSDDFFSPAARHSIIKSPLQFVLGTQKALEVQPNLKTSAQMIAKLGQDLFQPPTVKGWEGGRLWITSATLLQRANFAAELTGKIDIKTPNIAKLAELLLASDADIQPVHDFLQGTSKNIQGALHLLLTMPEYQLT